FNVMGIDAAPDAIAAAAVHAAGKELPLAYRVAAPEDFLAEGAQFPIVTALEVIEHVPDPALFLRTLAGLLEPGGLVVLSTLNRTTLSFAAAKLAAEYLLRWLPVGTHDWRRFLTPTELATALRLAGLRVSDLTGLGLDPRSGQWRTGGATSVNYMMAARR
ncbi:MAG: bifunctional 2-polyprenyl-6-hydroxyphenol methylase/3-demethylubiquinol 3-O-methyltransferase UbiG, partial [Acetobacteraceae bacterium]